MDLSLKKIELKQVAPDRVALFRGDEPLMCPYVNRVVVPVQVPSSLMQPGGPQQQLTVDSVPCGSHCAVFELQDKFIANIRNSKYQLRRGCCSTDILFDESLKEV